MSNPHSIKETRETAMLRMIEVMGVNEMAKQMGIKEINYESDFISFRYVGQLYKLTLRPVTR